MKSTYRSPIERGILTSAYKKEIKENIRFMRADSLSRIKSIIANNAENSINHTAVFVKVSFIMLLVLVFAI